MSAIFKKKVDFYRVACRRFVLDYVFQDDMFPGAGELIERSKCLKSAYVEICPVEYSMLAICEGEFLMKFPKYGNSILHFRLYHEEVGAYSFTGEQVTSLVTSITS